MENNCGGRLRYKNMFSQEPEETFALIKCFNTAEREDELELSLSLIHSGVASLVQCEGGCV